MPRAITQYRVFIASPGGLEDERRRFRHVLDKYTARDAEPRGVAFHPVGWEETVCGVGRPQVLINEDLKQCDYAVFVLHDRWGSPTGNGHTSGTAEEWKLAEELYEALKIRNIALFFKHVDPRQLKDPGEQLRKVLDFRKRIMEGRRYLFKDFLETNDFGELVENHLSQWLRDHERAANTDLSDAPTFPTPSPCMPDLNHATLAAPHFDYWITESDRLGSANISDHIGAEFCALRATKEAKTDIERARASFNLGVARLRLSKPEDAMAEFTAVIDEFSKSGDTERRSWFARCLNGKGASLGTLGRSEEAIAVFNELLERFSTSSDLPLRERVANALVNKGVALDSLGRSDEEIAAYDDVVARFGQAVELSLRELVAKAQIYKGETLRDIGRFEDAITVYDEVLRQIGTTNEVSLQEWDAKALVGKGEAYELLGQREMAISAYENVLARFGTETENDFRELIDLAAENKKNLEKQRD